MAARTVIVMKTMIIMITTSEAASFFLFMCRH
jgi:hypothetical protein